MITSLLVSTLLIFFLFLLSPHPYFFFISMLIPLQPSYIYFPPSPFLYAQPPRFPLSNHRSFSFPSKQSPLLRLLHLFQLFKFVEFTCTLLLVLFSCFFPFVTKAGLVPALYVFGDSLVDCGNNNYLDTRAKGNRPPNGIDFPGRVSTGRASNGFIMPDFFAQFMGLPLVPPILGCKDNEESCKNNLTGFNFGSGSSGILPETGSGERLDLSKQAALFNNAVATYLQPGLKTPAALSRHLAESIFFFCSGSNDIGLTYLRMNRTSRPKPETFVKLLSDLLGDQLEIIYKFGARKFLVFNIPPVGCPPGFNCTEDPTIVVDKYNRKLKTKLKQLHSTLPGSFFVLADIFKLARTIIENPSAYGFKDVEHSCIKDNIPCENRDEYFPWDGIHPTQAADKVFAMTVFNGTGFTSPMNVVNLIKL